MAEHTYTGTISFGFSVSADKPLTKQEIIDQIANDIPTFGIPECDLGDIDHYIECPECGEMSDDFRGDWCKDCDKQGGAN